MWSYTAGEHGHKVTVFERTPGGNICIRKWDSERGNWAVRSLGHRSKDKARREAHKLADAGPSTDEWKLGDLFEAYRKERSPHKSKSSRRADLYRIDLFNRFLGRDRKAIDIPLSKWEEFIRLRGSGRLRPSGSTADSGVGKRTVEADLKWLKAVLRWAEQRSYISRSSVGAYPTPSERNPKQRVATEDEYQALLSAADLVPTRRTALLRPLLVLSNDTGRRITSILSIRSSDIVFDAPPYGGLLWREDADKMGKRWVAPITQNVRLELLFLCAQKEGELFEGVSRYLAAKWLRKACDLTGVKPLGWHCFRRKWASERPLTQATAMAGGWKNVNTMIASYSKPDWDGMVDAVINPTPYRGMT